jgi:hypothetical protein
MGNFNCLPRKLYTGVSINKGHFAPVLISQSYGGVHRLKCPYGVVTVHSPLTAYSTNVTHKPKCCQGSFSSQCSPRNYTVVSTGTNIIYPTATLHSSLITFSIKTTGWPTFYQEALLSECLSQNQMVQSVGKNIHTTLLQCIPTVITSILRVKLHSEK